jgi:hypothetical protein
MIILPPHSHAPPNHAGGFLRSAPSSLPPSTFVLSTLVAEGVFWRRCSVGDRARGMARRVLLQLCRSGGRLAVCLCSSIPDVSPTWLHLLHVGDVDAPSLGHFPPALQSSSCGSRPSPLLKVLHH